jgi:hypothetical protein
MNDETDFDNSPNSRSPNAETSITQQKSNGNFTNNPGINSEKLYDHFYEQQEKKEERNQFGTFFHVNFNSIPENMLLSEPKEDQTPGIIKVGNQIYFENPSINK